MFDGLITVLMTVYNGGAYLPKAIDSVLSQTYTNFELLIVDDCSTDGSFDYIKGLLDERIVLIRNANNLGQTKSLNVGLRQARGRYVARMDADDLAFPHWLEVQTANMEHGEGCAVLSPMAVVIDSNDKLIKKLNNPVKPQDIIFKSIFASPINHVGCFMRRETMLQVGGYDEKYKIVADFALWSKVIASGYRIKAAPQILVAVRTHAQSVSIVEANNKVIPEMTEIIRGNVVSLTSLGLSLPQAILLWQTAYAGHALNLAQFLEGIGIFKSIYYSFKTHGDRELIQAKQFFYNQERVFFLKRAWGLVKAKDFANALSTAGAYLKLHGPLNIFLTLWCLTFLGYSQFICLWTLKKVKFQ